MMLSLALVCVSMSAWAAKYSVEVNVTTQKVAILRDGKLVKGSNVDKGSNLAVVKLEKRDGDIYASIASVKSMPMTGIESCRVQKDGTLSIYGISYQDAKISRAYREAKEYLDKTDEPIEVTFYTE